VKKLLWIIGALVLVSIPLVLCSQSLLRALGWALVAEDPLQRADAIVVSVDAGAAGTLEATDLFKAQLADHVAVFEEESSVAVLELRRRGLTVRDTGAISVERLRQLGVTASEVIAMPVDGTEDERRMLPLWCEEHHVHRLIFVSSRDHTRRTRHLLRRALRARHITLIERAARYSSFDPDSWWRSRNGVRTEIMELQKLAWELL
jgi:uncharacterized SAM-binding protein YcdF (DUF218 family)